VSTNYIDEYLVKLGATVDQSGMARFHQALREASLAADVSAMSIAGAFFKAQTEIIGGFTAVGSAALGLVDKVAMADQQYRLFALHMYMSKDAARSLKVAMDALGEPLENLTWDAELRARTHQLIVDQTAMAPNGDFEAQMRKIRDIRFEFTRMEVEGQYLAMHVVQDFMKALGVGPDELLTKLRAFNDWVTHNLPQISTRLVNDFLPVWKDLKDVAIATGQALMAVGLAFTNIVGALSGDKSIQGAAFDFDKFAGALVHVVHWFALFAELIDKIVEGLADMAAGLGDVFSAVPAPILDTVIGATLGGIVGGPGGALAGGVGGAALGIFGGGGKAGASVGGAALGIFGGGGNAGASVGSASVHELIDRYASSMGVDPALAHAVAMHESGEQQYTKSGALQRNPGSTATGVYQLLNGTARYLGVDSTDTEGNVKGGVKYLSQLLAHYNERYHGDTATAAAIGGYGVGQGEMDAIIAGRMTPHRDEALSNIAGVMRMMGKSGDFQVGSVTIHVTQRPGEDGKALATRIKGELQDTQNKRIQRNMSEFQDLSWSS
jgi:hypothetical protein